MKNRLLTTTTLLFCGLILFSCNKGKWKETVETKINISLTNSSIFFGVNEFKIDTLYIELESLILDGSRIQAENIHLSESIATEYLLTPGSTENVSSFSVPQGTYETFQFTTKIGNTSPSIKLIGRYILASGSVKHVNLNLNYDEFLLQDLVKSNAISIDKNEPGIITIELDAEVLFDNINPSYWNSASSSQVQGQEVIDISNGNNQSMHNAIHSKISESISVDFE